MPTWRICPPLVPRAYYAAEHSYLHDKAEDVGIIIKHNAGTDISFELPRGVGHDAGREISFNLAEKLVMDDDFLRWEFHRCCMVALHTSQHDPVSHETQLAKSFPTEFRVLSLRDWIQQLLVEDRDMVKTGMVTACTSLLLVLVPVKLSATALLAKVTCERLDL